MLSFLAEHRQIITTTIPWFLSALTLYMTWMTGEKKRSTWLFGLALQGFWFFYTYISQHYGFLPLNIGLTIMYLNNHFKWNRKEVPNE